MYTSFATLRKSIKRYDAVRKIFLANCDAMRYIYNSMNRVIKKYGNRKLYDTVESKYVSLRTIKQLIRDGETVKIIERETGRDITSEVLTKAILEDTQDKRDEITSNTLHDLIRWGSDTLGAGLSKVSKGINRMLPVADLEDVKTLQQQIRELENKVDRLQSRLSETKKKKKKPATGKGN